MELNEERISMTMTDFRRLIKEEVAKEMMTIK